MPDEFVMIAAYVKTAQRLEDAKQTIYEYLRNFKGWTYYIRVLLKLQEE